MDFGVLNDLLNKPKKTDASKATRRSYIEQVMLLLKEEGFSPTAIKYLKGGFSYAGAKPIALYIQELPEEKKVDEINRLLQSEIFKGNDNSSAFRFGVSLTAYSIELLGNKKQLLAELIKLLPYFSRSKGNNLLKDAPKIFEKHFLDTVSEKTIFPNLDDMGLNQNFVSEFRNLLTDILSKISKTYIVKAKQVYEWINVAVPNDDAFLTDNKTAGKDENGSARQELPKPAQPVVVEPLNIEELLKIITQMKLFADRLEATAKAFDDSKRDYRLLKEEKISLERRLKCLQENLLSEQHKNEKASNDIEEKKSIIADLNIKLNDTRNIVATKEQENAILSEENERLKSIMTVYSADKQNSLTEQLNAIALNLKTEYKDFTDAKEMEMTTDLGENFRLQLQSVFAILSKSGIDMEKR